MTVEEHNQAFLRSVYRSMAEHNAKLVIGVAMTKDREVKIECADGFDATEMANIMRKVADELEAKGNSRIILLD